MLKIGLTYNLKRNSKSSDVADYDAEYDDQSTVDAIADALSETGEVVKIEADEDAYNLLRYTKPDVVFNIAEGVGGESRESHIPAMLEMLGIPYTGSGPLTLAAALNKAVTNGLLSSRGVRTPRCQIFKTVGDVDHLKIEYPVVVKPLHEGSSKGVWNNSLARGEEELKERVKRVIDIYRQPALVEEYIGGREFTAALLGNSPPDLLPLVEVRLDRLPPEANKIYSYEAKWVWDTCENPLEIFECPAAVPLEIYKEVRHSVIQTFNILECRDLCRIDVRLDDEDRCCVLDVNPLPGLIPDPRAHSCFPEAARAAGLSYGELVRSILYCALDRYGLKGLAPDFTSGGSHAVVRRVAAP